MANEEHVKILRQGVEVWNQWRKDNLDVEPDLSDLNFEGKQLRDVNLSDADLSDADLSGIDLSDADLRGADFSGTDLSVANLSGANLKGSNLSFANLTEADLIDTDLTSILTGYTVFANLDLSMTEGLTKVQHGGPSSLGIDTIFKSKGKIPEIFLRGCGVPETLITFLPSMMAEAIQFYSCFISYSHADKAFAQLLHDRLQGKGIRCWLDEHQLNPGDKLHETIYSGIRVYDKVILCCSETSLRSKWVKTEFENLIAKEEDFEEALLIPVALDNYLFDQSADEWLIGEIRKKRLVQSFVNWKDHDTFEASFAKVVKALRTDGGKPPPPPSKLTPRK